MNKHELLTQIEQDLEGINRTTDVEIGKHVFTLRLLSRSEETRARGMVDAENILAAFADSNVPQLAYAITHVNGTPAEALFVPVTDDDKSASENDPRRWRAQQMADWLGARPTTVVETLWLRYLKLKDSITKAMEELENFSKKTPSGA